MLTFLKDNITTLTFQMGYGYNISILVINPIAKNKILEHELMIMAKAPIAFSRGGVSGT